MITNFKSFVHRNHQGSSFMSPAHGWRGARATINFNNSPSAKKSGEARKQAGKKEEGWGEGIFARLPKRSPAALLVQSRAQQKSFLFLLEEKIGWAQIKKCEENFFAGWRASASGGGAERQSSQSGFSSKKVRILTKRHRQFSKFGFWAIVASPRQRRGSALARILKGFLKSKNNSCPLKRKFAVRSTDKMKFYQPIFFLSPLAKGKAII